MHDSPSQSALLSPLLFFMQSRIGVYSALFAALFVVFYVHYLVVVRRFKPLGHDSQLKRRRMAVLVCHICFRFACFLLWNGRSCFGMMHARGMLAKKETQRSLTKHTLST